MIVLHDKIRSEQFSWTYWIFQHPLLLSFIPNTLAAQRPIWLLLIQSPMPFQKYINRNLSRACGLKLPLVFWKIPNKFPFERTQTSPVRFSFFARPRVQQLHICPSQNLLPVKTFCFLHNLSKKKIQPSQKSKRGVKPGLGIEIGDSFGSFGCLQNLRVPLRVRVGRGSQTGSLLCVGEGDLAAATQVRPHRGGSGQQGWGSGCS